MLIKPKAFWLILVTAVLLGSAQFALADCTVRDNGGGSPDFAQAMQIPGDCSGTRTLIGNVGNSPSVDLFHQDQARGVGEKFIAGNTSTNPFLCALFDDQNNLLFIDRLCAGASLLDFDFREPTSATTLGIAAFGGTNGGNYNIPARVGAAGGPHDPVPQRVVLNFGGVTNFRVNNKPPISYGPFDSARLGARYVGQTELMRARIIELIRQTYAGYNVEISTDADPLPPQPYSTVNFGGEDDGFLGLADTVNSYNFTQSDNANVYLDSFSSYAVFNFSADDMSRMIANVASHELGHLLGLSHTADGNDIMDTTGTVYQLASHQDFTVAQLDRSVFPVGRQNSPSILSLTVGGSHIAPPPVPHYSWWDLY